MKLFFIPVFAGMIAATPVLADAEDFGKKMLKGSSSSPATFKTGADILEGDNVADQLPFNDPQVVTRDSNVLSQGHLALARAMKVNPEDFTTAELSKMFIGEYD